MEEPDIMQFTHSNMLEYIYVELYIYFFEIIS